MSSTRFVLVLLISTAACYNTVPVGTSTPVPGKELVLLLTDAGTAQLSGPLGQATTQVRGLYVDSSPDTLHLAMIATTLADGEERLWNKEIVGIPRQYVATTGQKVLSSSKTTSVAALGALAVVAVKAAFSGLTHTGGKTTGPPSGQ